jgi:transcriptional regulator with XRE-family HTH domain
VNKLSSLITSELETRGWSMRELGRRAGVSHAQISNVVSGSAKPGADFCLSVARAFRMPPEKVLRLGGLLPPLPGPEDDLVLKELLEVTKQLAPDGRQEVLEYAMWRYRRQQEQREQESSG